MAKKQIKKSAELPPIEINITEEEAIYQLELLKQIGKIAEGEDVDFSKGSKVKRKQKSLIEKLTGLEALEELFINEQLGRRNSPLEEFIVVCNYNNAERVNKNVKDFVEFAETLSNSAYPIVELGRRYGRQEENKNLQKYVYVYKGEYKLNQYAKAYLQYIQESYIQLGNYETKSTMNYVCKVGNRQLLLCDDYLAQLSRYAIDNQVDIEKVWNAIVKYNHSNAIEVFQKQEEKWLNKQLTSEDKKILCADLRLLRSQGKSASWKTVKDMLLQNGYTITDKRVGKDRKSISIISK